VLSCCQTAEGPPLSQLIFVTSIRQLCETEICARRCDNEHDIVKVYRAGEHSDVDRQDADASDEDLRRQSQR